MAERHAWKIETLQNNWHDWDMRVWKKVIAEKEDVCGLSTRKQGMSGKSALQWYENKVKPLAEIEYDGGYCSEL